MGTNLKTILLVEDELLTAFSVQSDLEKKGYAVRHALSGEESVQMVLGNDSPIDLILMDIDLGSGIDGTEAAERILAHRDIPVVFLSSHTEPEMVEKTEKITSYGYVVKNSGIVVLDASIKMAFRLQEAHLKQKRNEDALFAAKNLLTAAFEAVLDCIMIFTCKRNDRGEVIDFTFMDLNSNTENMLQMKREFLIGKEMCEVLPINRTAGFFEKYKKVYETGIPLEEEFYLPDTNVPAAWHSHQVMRSGDGILIVHRDITARKEAEKALRESRDLLNSTQRLAKIGGWEWDVEKRTMSWTDETYRIHGMEPGEPAAGSPEHVDRSLACYDPADRTVIGAAFRRCAEEGLAYDLDFPLTRVDGKRIWIRTMAYAVRDGARVEKVIGNIMDITERKVADEELAKQLSEKELLLKEVHHRVKNNIANIESFLTFQAGSSTNPEVKSALQDAVSRVQSMRVLYEKLLLGKDYHAINVKTYIESLIGSLSKVFPDSGTVIDYRIDDFILGAKKAIPVGIIINELLTNAFKYAFKDRDGGRVSVIIEKTGDTAVLTVQDNGIGIDERMDLNKSPGFGITIVRMLSEQLKGIFSARNDHGTKSVLKFKI